MNKPHVYYPRALVRPARLLDVPSAWRGIEDGLADLLQTFSADLTGTAADIGVDYGFSTAALANFFPRVLGIDTFESDYQTGERDADQYERVKALLTEAGITNVELRKIDFRDWLTTVEATRYYSLVHVDVLHEYQLTYQALRWAVAHSDLTIAHDTRSFSEVMRACADVAEETGVWFYEWDQHHGLGILSRKEPS